MQTSKCLLQWGLKYQTFQILDGRPFVLSCCKLNNTRDCDEHLFGQASTRTGHYQLPIFGCTKCTREDALAHNLGTVF